MREAIAPVKVGKTALYKALGNSASTVEGRVRSPFRPSVRSDHFLALTLGTIWARTMTAT